MYMLRRQHVHVGEGKKLRWTIASARQNLPEVVSLAAREPQDIYRRDKLVARVVSADDSSPSPARPSLADAFAELRQICAEEKYTLEIPGRTNRPNAFAEPVPRPKRGRRKR
jgi:hypothetical protein